MSTNKPATELHQALTSLKPYFLRAAGFSVVASLPGHRDTAKGDGGGQGFDPGLELGLQVVAMGAPVAKKLNHLYFARHSGRNRFCQRGVVFARLGFIGGVGRERVQACDACEKGQEHGQTTGQTEVASIHGEVHLGVEVNT